MTGSNNVTSDRANASPSFDLIIDVFPCIITRIVCQFPQGRPHCIPARLRCVCRIHARNTSLCEYTGVCQAGRPRSSFLPRPRSSLYQYVGKCGLPLGITHAYFESSVDPTCTRTRNQLIQRRCNCSHFLRVSFFL